MARGDHYEVLRPGYRHHGIDIGDGTVVHFTGEPFRKLDATVQRTSWDEFTRGDSYRLIPYTSWTWTPDHVCLRALRLEGMSGYHLLKLNCEHFATFCKNGQSRSAQVDSSVKRMVYVSRRGAMNPWMFLAGPAFGAARGMAVAAGHLVRKAAAQESSSPPPRQESWCSYFHYGELFVAPSDGTAIFATPYGQLYQLRDNSTVTTMRDDATHLGSLFVDDKLMIYNSQADGWFRFAPGDDRLRFVGTVYVSDGAHYILDASDGRWKKSLGSPPLAVPPDNAEFLAFLYLDASARLFLHKREGWYAGTAGQWVPETPYRTDLRFI